MSGDGGQSTDDASIKPVSSLRSHFEGLNVRKPSQEEGLPFRDTPKPLTPVSRSENPQTRGSFEIPRSESPWGGLKEPAISMPRTPGDLRPPDSPTRSAQKRPTSMLLQSSQQPTPSFTLDSPKSPPKGLFFSRSGSRSPERAVDSTPFGKVRDLISQHSSRSSTRPGTPQVGPTDLPEHPVVGDSAVLATLENNPKSPTIIPVFKKPEKPRIPAKPNTISGHDLSGLVTQARKPSLDARVSPFNTPPSTDDESLPDKTIPERLRKPGSVDAGRLQPAPRKASGHHEPLSAATGQTFQSRETPAAPVTRPAIPPERRDPRMLGFSSPAPAPPPPSRGISVSPTRANTVSERLPTREPRDHGIIKPAPRHVSETIRPTAPPMIPSQHREIHQTPQRDARQLGFSSPAESPRPGLPPRRTGTEPPRRPSEDFARPTARNTVQPSISSTTIDRSTKPGARAPSGIPEIPLLSPLPTNTHFLPPPKRATTSKEDGSPSLAPTRAGLIPASKAPLSETTKYSHGTREADSDEAEEAVEEQNTSSAEDPDTSQANRRPPSFETGLQKLPTECGARNFDVCGHYVCVGGYVTKVFDMSSGETVLNISHGETVKVTSIIFKPARDQDHEGTRLWIGNNLGDLQEIDIATYSTVATNSSHNRREIVRILRHRRDVWTLDDDGKLLVWPADESGAPSLKYTPLTHRVQKGHTFSMVVHDNLWLATGKEIRIYKPGNEASFAPLTKPLGQPEAGEVTSGTYSPRNGGRVFFGHDRGWVTMYSAKDVTYLSTFKASVYKINGLVFVGDYLWAAYRTKKISVYDISTVPWKTKKTWDAHEGPISGIILDPSSAWTLQRLQVVSLGNDNIIKLWDGTLEDDWLETAIQASDSEYCNFHDIKAAVVTWNVGATNPSELRGDFLAEAIHAHNPPDILSFGFQEVVDLEDRTVTAKSLLGFGKKKDPAKTEQHQSRVYREWRDFLSKVVNRSVNSSYSYSELHTSNLVGLFQCLFVRTDQKDRVSGVDASVVKCGMGGRYGNKGALITRFFLDHSSLCFVNCHLAAGQNHTPQRNNDVRTILEAENLSSQQDRDLRSSYFVGGGDGCQILDHEICILNGDLNYRIDSIPRDSVIAMINRNDLGRLLKRDQILASRRKAGSGFRLAPFTELPITFAPTYKYDVGKDTYDSSEKKRSPAWCDRLLYRGASGQIQQMEYRRHEVRASDHRPVSGIFHIQVKTIDEARRSRTQDRCLRLFADVRRKLLADASWTYLVGHRAMSDRDARALLEAGHHHHPGR